MKYSFFWLLLLTFLGTAQNTDLEKVTKAQLEQKVHPKDTTAVAAFLFKKVRTVFDYSEKEGFTTKTEYSIKIKIYKKEGFDWGNFEIPYYVGYTNLNDERVSVLKAFTYNLEEGKVIKQKVTGDSKFKQKINDLWETKIVTFPNVKVGSIIELKYEFKSENLSELPSFQYQYKIPVDYAVYTTEIPVLYLYKAIKTGFIDVKMEDKLESASREYSDARQATKFLTYQQIKTVYEATDVPSLVDEDYVSNIDNYYAKIENELKTIQFPNEPVKEIATTWEAVTKSIYEEKDFGGELKKSDYYLADLKKLIDNVDSKEERLKLIFEFVKNKMAWDNKYGYFSKKGVAAAYSQNTGNSAEINLILTSMLKMAGLDANPVLLSTRNNGLATFPNRSKFNYVIAAVNVGGNQILLDATNKLCPMGVLPNRDLNTEGRLISKDGTSVVINLMPKNNSLKTYSLFGALAPDGLFTAKIRQQYFDYFALSFREKYSGVSKESYIEKVLEKQSKGLTVDDYEIKNEKDIYEPIIESYAVKNDNVAEIIGDKMYFSPMLYLAQDQNPFKQNDRQYPVDFSFPLKEKYNIIIKIPPGYAVESMPSASAFKMVDNYASFSFASSAANDQVTVVVSLEINEAVIPSQYYDSLKEFFKLAVDKQNAKVVLKKI